ncbi:histidine-rich glycoprotein-like [Bicyclus anynana]|uniref:Histidine-rich glycoprotein-like n=1 Tax=Bicyclus anynana TaxID=110368 RepID=A0A6J1NRE7_BICAN|nr:histidine-rich glycoprotein-like [Bicyclus anynana]
MKAYILITLLVVQVATATLTIDKITEKVHEGLKILKDKAVHKLHKLKHEFDLKKLHQLHAIHWLPYAHKHYVHEHYSKKTPLVVDHHQIERLKHYFEPHHKPVHFHHVEHKPPVLHHLEHHKPVHFQHYQHFEHVKV